MKKLKGYQVLHKEDNGELILIRVDNEMQILCKKCKQNFILNIPISIGMSKDFKLYKPKNK